MAFTKLMHTLKAAPSDGNVKSRLVKPDDLDIYYEPDFVLQDSQVSSELQPPQILLTYVSAIRKRMWRFKDVTLDTYNRAENALASVKYRAVDVYNTAKTNPLSMLRPGCIAAAAVTGAIVHGRGRKPVLRLTTATIAGTLVASVAYPDKALNTAKKIYYNGKEASLSLVDMMKNWAEERKQVDVKGRAEDTAATVNAVEKDGVNESDDGMHVKEDESIGSSFVVLDANGEEVCPVDALELESVAGDNLQKESDDPAVSEMGELRTNMDSESKEKAGHRGEHKIIQAKEQNINNASIVDSMVDYGQSSPEDNDMYSTRS